MYWRAGTLEYTLAYTGIGDDLRSRNSGELPPDDGHVSLFVERVIGMPTATSNEVTKTEFGEETAAEWGEMRMDFAAFPPHNLAPLLRGLPGDRCQCPHWGYLFKGKILVRYADHEETISAGEAFFIAPGHVPEALEDCELVQFSPSAQLHEVIEVMRRNAQAMDPGVGIPSSRRAAAEIVSRND